MHGFSNSYFHPDPHMLGPSAIAATSSTTAIEPDGASTGPFCATVPTQTKTATAADRLQRIHSMGMVSNLD